MHCRASPRPAARSHARLEHGNIALSVYGTPSGRLPSGLATVTVMNRDACYQNLLPGQGMALSKIRARVSTLLLTLKMLRNRCIRSKNFQK